MIDDLATQALLGEFRGEPPVDRDALCRGAARPVRRCSGRRPHRVGRSQPPDRVAGRPVAVDALVEVRPDAHHRAVRGPVRARGRGGRRRLDPPGQVRVREPAQPAGRRLQGKVFATNLQGEEVLGIQTVPSMLDVPQGEADLVFVCTPAGANPQLLRDCCGAGHQGCVHHLGGLRRGGRGGSGGRTGAGRAGRGAGHPHRRPNGQGVVSTPAKLCAQIVAPNPPPGRIGVASQSGNFVSSFMNLGVQTGIGFSRGVSAGNAAMATVADYLEFYGQDPRPRWRWPTSRASPTVGRSSIASGAWPPPSRSSWSRAGPPPRGSGPRPATPARSRPTTGVRRRVPSGRGHTGRHRRRGLRRGRHFATQPLPKGNRVVVLTTAGGWGVVTADASLAPASTSSRCPTTCWPRSTPSSRPAGAATTRRPGRWRDPRHHPRGHGDGGQPPRGRRDHLPRAGHPVEPGQAHAQRPFYPDHGLERIVEYHERQDARFAQAAADISEATGKPILTATELATADPDNPGPATVRATGRLCYPSSHRAVVALDHMWRYARLRSRRS
jgi:hypothetical protein